MAFAATRMHRRGELGNAILSRWPMSGVSVLDLSFSRMERRLAMAAQFRFEGGLIDVVARCARCSIIRTSRGGRRCCWAT